MKRMISGIKPTGQVHLGNYLGAIKPFITYQDDYQLYVFIANLHALTLPIDPKELKKNTEDLLRIYLAAGLKNAAIFKQSDILEHTQLEWILTCNTVLGEFTKMPQYKNYLDSHPNQATPTGMLMYPSLMNADILLYDADYVPCGVDQKPHVDLTRDVAEKFNKKYGCDVFKLPEAVVARTGAKIMSLSNPTKKMSKSESDKGTIYLLENVSITRKKIMKAVTDNLNKVHYDPENQPGVSNLMTIYSCFTNMSFNEIEDKYIGKNYGVFKSDLADIVCDELSKLQEKVNSFSDDELAIILASGYSYAHKLASYKMRVINKTIGLI